MWLSSRRAGHVVNFYTLFAYIYFSADDLNMPGSDCASSSVLFVHNYAHTCVCPDKAAQMYFGSMNYATRIYITSNYLIVTKPAFSFARTTCARQTFSRKG